MKNGTRVRVRIPGHKVFGNVVERVPAGKLPSVQVLAAYADFLGQPRGHDSYLVRCDDRHGNHGTGELRWPEVRKIERIAPFHTPECDVVGCAGCATE